MQQLGDDKGISLLKTNVVNGNYVGMAEGRGSTGFLLKATEMVLLPGGSRLDQFKSNVARQTLVTRAKNLSHATSTDLFQNPVMTDDLANHNLQRRFPHAC